MTRMGHKLCDITMFYPTSGAGGVKNYILSKREYALSHTSWQHGLVVPHQDTNEPWQQHARPTNPIDYMISSPVCFWNPTYRFLWSYRPIMRALSHFSPDIIEVGCPYAAPWLVNAGYRKQSLPHRPTLIGFCHANPKADLATLLSPIKPLKFLGDHFADWYMRKVYNLMDITLVSAPKIKERLEKIGINNVEVVPFGVDTSVFYPREQPPSSSAHINLLYVGRVSIDKGIISFLKLMHLMRQNGIAVKLTVVGGGAQLEQAKKIAGDVDYIDFLSFISSKSELAKIYSRHDLLVVPADNETFCLSALESMACGTPVATLNGNGGIEVLVNRNTGFLLGRDIHNFVKFLSKLNRLALLRMRPSTKRFAHQNFSKNRRFAELFALYERCLTDGLSRLPARRLYS